MHALPVAPGAAILTGLRWRGELTLSNARSVHRMRIAASMDAKSLHNTRYWKLSALILKDLARFSSYQYPQAQHLVVARLFGIINPLPLVIACSAPH